MPQDPPGTEPVSSRIEKCYRHADVTTGVHCTRCDRPICPDCMIEAPVGHQCPECVKEARRAYREGPGRRVRAAGRASAVTLLLGAILVMFGAEAVLARGAIFRIPSDVLGRLGAMHPILVADGEWWRLITATFLHAGVIHIAFNAWALYAFGAMVEDAYGRLGLLWLFLVCGFLASVASYAAWPTTELGHPSVGASGGVFGLLGAFGVQAFRRGRVLELQNVVFLVAINLILGFSLAFVDNRAHVGGLLAGVAAGFLMEGVGPRRLRVPIRVAGFAAMIALGVAAVAWRTAALERLVGAFL